MATSSRRVLVIANPRAGLRRGRDAGAEAAKAAAVGGREVTLHRTTAPGDARHAAAAAAAEGFDLVIAVGGDGTVHEAANGVIGTPTALAVAPAGTMNILARVLGLPLDAAQAASLAVRSARRRRVRPGLANGVVFLLMAGIGFDAWVLRELLNRRAAKIRFRDYAWAAMTSLARYPYPDIRFVHGDQTIAGHSGIVGRTDLYGGFLRPTPRARLDDDVLELCVLQGRSLELLRLAPAIWSGSHVGKPGVVSALGERIDASSTTADVPVQLDGEIAGLLPMSFSIADDYLVIAA